MKKKNRPSDKETTAAVLVNIAARVGKLADEAEPTPSWRDKVKAALTGTADRREGMIRAGQAMRDAGKDIDFANLTICIGAENIAEDRIKTDAGLARISAAIKKKEKKYGLKEDEYWPPGEAPDDVETLQAAFNKRCRQIMADVLREFGEDEMAAALLADEDAFDAKYREPGRLAHFGPHPKRRGNTGSS